MLNFLISFNDCWLYIFTILILFVWSLFHPRFNLLHRIIYIEHYSMCRYPNVCTHDVLYRLEPLNAFLVSRPCWRKIMAVEVATAVQLAQPEAYKCVGFMLLLPCECSKFKVLVHGKKAIYRFYCNEGVSFLRCFSTSRHVLIHQQKFICVLLQEI